MGLAQLSLCLPRARWPPCSWQTEAARGTLFLSRAAWSWSLRKPRETSAFGGSHGPGFFLALATPVIRTCVFFMLFLFFLYLLHQNARAMR